MLFCKMTNFIHFDMKNSLAADLCPLQKYRLTDFTTNYTEVELIYFYWVNYIVFVYVYAHQ